MALSFFDTQFFIGKYQAKKIDFFSDVRFDSLYYFSNADSLDSLNYSDSSLYVIQDSVLPLGYFFKAMVDSTTRSKKIRIAYFGDSMIEGDLITQDLRSLFQNQFGGSGVGFVPVTSIASRFRQTINHSFSKDWESYSLLDNVSDMYPLGIAGFSFVPHVLTDSNHSPKMWVRFKGVKKVGLDSFSIVKFFYGPSSAQNKITVNDKKYTLIGRKQVNQLVLSMHPLKTLQVDFNYFKSAPVYGFSFESDSGAIVDNFSFRGNSGIPLVKITDSVWKQFNQYLHYDLVILHYGLNVASPKSSEFSWYARRMAQVVSLIRKNMPQTSILIISVGDRSYRKEGSYITIPSIPKLVEVQQTLAEKMNLGFWNLYEAMGGEGSMVNWVEGDTVLANKDYTHLNFKGAKKVAYLLYDYLMKEFENYKELKKKPQGFTAKAPSH